MGEELTFEADRLIVKIGHGRITVTSHKDEIFTSLESRYLPRYLDFRVDAMSFDTDESLEGVNDEYARNYRRFLGTRNVHLGQLETSGFLNERYDLTFCFGTDYILAKHCLVCDHDLLSKLLLYGSNSPVKSVFKQKKDYAFGDEVLVKSVDLSRASRVLTYSPAAVDALKANNFPEEMPKVDLAEFRPRAIDLYFK